MSKARQLAALRRPAALAAACTLAISIPAQAQQWQRGRPGAAVPQDRPTFQTPPQEQPREGWGYDYRRDGQGAYGDQDYGFGYDRYRMRYDDWYNVQAGVGRQPAGMNAWEQRQWEQDPWDEGGWGAQPWRPTDQGYIVTSPSVVDQGAAIYRGTRWQNAAPYGRTSWPEPSPYGRTRWGELENTAYGQTSYRQQTRPGRGTWQRDRYGHGGVIEPQVRAQDPWARPWEGQPYGQTGRVQQDPRMGQQTARPGPAQAYPQPDPWGAGGWNAPRPAPTQGPWRQDVAYAEQPTTGYGQVYWQPRQPHRWRYNASGAWVSDPVQDRRPVGPYGFGGGGAEAHQYRYYVGTYDYTLAPRGDPSGWADMVGLEPGASAAAGVPPPPIDRTIPNVTGTRYTTGQVFTDDRGRPGTYDYGFGVTGGADDRWRDDRSFRRPRQNP